MDNKLSVPRGPLSPGVKLDENVYVEMRDGIKIAIDIYRPEADGRYPALVSMSPYMKEIQQWSPVVSHSIEAGNTSFFVTKGYVHVIATVRGSGFSQGQFNSYDIKQQQDGYDLIEWVSKQSWCSGNVGMIGDSYFAKIQSLIAAQQPPHLKCIVPFDGTTDEYRDARCKGGLLYQRMIGSWCFDTLCQCLWPGPVDGKITPDLFTGLATHPEDGPYYWERSAWTKSEKIKVPVLSIVNAHGFLHSRGQLAIYPELKIPKKLIISPPTDRLTNVFFITSIPLNTQILRWLDYWLKDIDTGIMNEPEIAIYDNGTKEWRYENEYPLARTGWKKFYLHGNSSGFANQPPYGLISAQPPENEKPDQYSTPECLHLVEADKPVLAYVTPSLESDLRVWGPLSVTLYGSSTTSDTVWFVKVADVGPQGETKILVQGVLKASFREIDKTRSKPGQPFHPFQNPVLLEPNEVYEYEIELTPIFHTFKVGHKMRLQVASHDFFYQNPLNTMSAVDMLPLPAKNTIYHDLQHPSHLLLPVISDAPIIKPVGPPVSEIKWPI